MSKKLKLISLGARGVGKTVFLVSNCKDALHGKQANPSESQWFECRDQTTKENVEKLLAYVHKNHTYPPATFKISDFKISLKKKGMGAVKTLCDLEWLDIPGEWCSIEHPEFQSALLESHGCCVFVDADALLNKPNYAKSLQQTIQQIEAIASLIQQNHLIQYPIALICTKYDLLHSDTIGLIKLEEKLKPLIQKIELAQIPYKQFYSAIPLGKKQGSGIIQQTNANQALIWMTSELNRIHPTDQTKSLGQALNSIVRDQPKGGLTRSSQAGRLVNLSTPKNLIIAMVAGCGIIAALSALSLTLLNPKTTQNPAIESQITGFREVLKSDPNNESAISGIVNTYAEVGAYNEAIAELQALHEANPSSINILESLVTLYPLIDQPEKQEEYYNKILALEDDNFTALLGKAQLKAQNGDTKAAIEILKNAEDKAKNPVLKAEIQKLSQQIINAK